MVPVFDYDATKYRQAASDLMRTFRIDGKEMLRDESRLLVRDLMKLTPPANNGGLSAGQRAAERDVGKVFLPIRKALKLMREAMGSDRVSKLVTLLLRKGKFEQAKYWLLPSTQGNMLVRVSEHTRSGHRVGQYYQTRKITSHPIPGVTTATEVTPYFDRTKHPQRRNNWGRINGAYYSQILLDNRAGQALRRYIQEVKSRVGFSLAGWIPSADKMGFRAIPAWVAKHRGKAPGNIIDSTNAPSDKMSVTLVNRSSKIPNLQHVVNGAVKMRMRNFELDAARILAGGKSRRGFFRGTSVFGKEA